MVEDPTTVTYSISPLPSGKLDPNTLHALGYEASMPDICGYYNRSLVYPPLSYFEVDIPFNNTPTYNGAMEDLDWYDEVEIEPSQKLLDNAIPCATIAFLISRANGQLETGTGNKDNETAMVTSDQTVLACWQGVQEVMVDATFLMPGFTIDPNHPPIPIESTTKDLVSITGTSNFNFKTEEHVRYEMSKSQLETPGYLHPAVYAMVHGRWGVPADEFFGDGGGQTFSKSANIVWSTYMAQAISINFRQSVQTDTNEHNLVYTGSAVQAERGRLKQDAAVKGALQAMLGLMALCGLLVYLITDTERILPHDPCSIAGMMALFVDSEFIEREDLIPSGSEWNTCEDDERMWEGWLFSLGWFKTSSNQWRYGIDVGMAEEHETRSPRWKQNLARKWQ